MRSHSYWPKRQGKSFPSMVLSRADFLSFFFNFYCSEVSNIHLVTKDYKIVPLTNLLRLMLAGRVMGGSVLLGYMGVAVKNIYKGKNHCNRWVGVKGECG